MKKQIISVVIASAFIFSANHALSYRKIDNDGLVQDGSTPTNATSKAAGCSPSSAILTMEFNDVSALLEQGGSLWQDRGQSIAAYEIPKGSGLRVIYAGSLWMGGTDINGQLKLAGLTFRNNEDFWPGPLSIDLGTGTYDPSNPVGDDVIRDFGAATIDEEACVAYDKFYTIRKSEVIQYSKWFDCDQGIIPAANCLDIVKPENEVISRIYEWPAHGDASKNQDFFLAPFYDNPNGGGSINVYEPELGDYPWYDDILGRDDVTCGFDRRITLFGDETHWWVFNDVGNIHGETNGEPIGMEIRAQAFAFATNDEVNRMTFYNYELINRGTQTLYNTYFSQYIDADVGGADDDFVGCDVSRGLGYMYNGEAIDDGSTGSNGYGENPPAVGCDFFEGPYQDADGRDNVGPYFDTVLQVDVIPTVAEALLDTGIVYGGIGIGYSDGVIDNERFGMRRFSYYTNSANYPYSDPSNAIEFYNFMQGNWADGSDMVFGGDGSAGSAGATSILSDYLFPGDSDTLNWATKGVPTTFPWSEVEPSQGTTTQNDPDDRRFVQSAGPFTLRPGAVNNITVGIVYGRNTSGGSFPSVDAMKSADTKAQALFDACFRILEPPYAPKLVIQELENQLVLVLTNPSSSNNFLEAYKEEDKINIVDPTVDRFYTFEGYQIYQMADEDAGVSDIGDNSKAQLIAQCDIQNGIGDLDNFVLNEELGFALGEEKVDAANLGIQHSFVVDNDLFAQGVKTLVNNKRYYYIAIAYAHNEYAPYSPNDPTLFDGQKIPYISSRLGYDGGSIEAVEAIPHNPMAEAGGTVQNSVYGSSPQITKLDGYGNGGNALDLTAASRNSILTSGHIMNPVYEGGRGPLNVKVIDPLNVADGYYECTFSDYPFNFTNAADGAAWTIKRYASKGGAFVDSVSSDMLIDINNEQIIPQWGVSVNIVQNNYEYPAGQSGTGFLSTDLIESSITFSDISKSWLIGIPDSDGFNPTNWIRSGTHNLDQDNTTAAIDCPIDPLNYQDECSYPDYPGVDDSKIFTQVVNGIVAPFRLVGGHAAYMPIAFYNNDGSLARSKASIAFSPSVDIVFTADKSKWTRCPVIELGRESLLNVGGAAPGQLRRSPSLDINGNEIAGETGTSWFPGYAVDVESGARLYMAFGENSFLTNDNGADMKWNPTGRFFDATGKPVLGGMHPVYVFNYQKETINNVSFSGNFPPYVPSEGENLATNYVIQEMIDIDAGAGSIPNVFGNISWVVNPMVRPDRYLLESEATIKVRVNKEYKTFSSHEGATTGPNNGRPMYSWNMDDLKTETESRESLARVLDLIKVVPNPYYAYSEYENNRLDTRVKFTNLPDVCTIKIYSTNGKLVRTFTKDSPVTFVDWDLNNHKGIPIAGGIYLIHVDVPEVGETILKFFGGMRQVDLQGI